MRLLWIILIWGLFKHKEKVTIVYFSKVDTVLSKEISKQIKRVYKKDVEVINIPFDTCKSFSFRADSVAKQLGCLNKNFVIGLTEKHLFIECFYQDLDVMGYTSEIDRAAIVSSGSFSFEGNNNHLVSTVLHELGHAHGLNHCLNTDCFMLSREFESTPYHICSSCKKKLKSKL